MNLINSVSSGMGTCGFVGQIGVLTGWVSPSEKALAMGEVAHNAVALDYIGLILICFVLPAVICFSLRYLMEKYGLIKSEDLKL